MPAQIPELPPSKRFPRHTWRDPLAHLVTLNQVDPEPVQWLSPGRLAAGKLTLLDGDPGLGKSTLLCDWAARITRGHPLPDGAPSSPRAVLLLSAEDDLRDTIRPRIEAAGGDPRLILSLLCVPDGPSGDRPLNLPGDLPLLETIVRHSSAALLIIDPLMAYLQRRHNANSDQDVRRALLALKTLGEQTGVAIIVVRHLNKNTSSAANPLYRGGGSIGIIGAARCGLLLAADPDDPTRRILAPTKANLGLPPPSLSFHLEPVPHPHFGVARVVWDGPTSWTATDLLQATATPPSPTTPSALDAARAWLRATLASGPRPTTDIEHEAAAIGITPQTLKRARKAEGITAKKEPATAGRWLLELPQTSSESEEGHPP